MVDLTTRRSIPALEAFLLPPRNPATAKVRVRGLGLAERAILALHRSGVERIVVSRGCGIPAETLARLVHRGVPVAVARESQMDAMTAGRTVVVVSADVLFEPAAVRALTGRLAWRRLPAVAAAEASPGTFAAFTPGAAQALRGAAGDRDLLDRMDNVRVASLDTVFCRAIDSPRDAAAVQRACLDRSSAVDGLLARVARLFSIPVTRAFLRVRMIAG